jgi:hypothetical protein
MNLLSIYSRVFRGGDPQSDAVALDGNDGDANIVADDELLPNLARVNKHEGTLMRTEPSSWTGGIPPSWAPLTMSPTRK